MLTLPFFPSSEFISPWCDLGKPGPEAPFQFSWKQSFQDSVTKPDRPWENSTNRGRRNPAKAGQALQVAFFIKFRRLKSAATSIFMVFTQSAELGNEEKERHTFPHFKYFSIQSTQRL